MQANLDPWSLMLKRAARYVRDSWRGGAPFRWTRLREYGVGMLRYAEAIRNDVCDPYSLPKSFCAVLTSFGRPENMPWLIAAFLRAPFVCEILLLNNNASVPMKKLLPCKDPRIVPIQALRNDPVAWRLVHAAARPWSYFLIVDDDVFLQPQQIVALARKLVDAPECPHGVLGDIWEPDGVSGSRRVWPRAQDVAVDDLLRVYALSNEHLREAMRLMKTAGEAGLDFSFCDDLLISCSGTQRPRIHDVGQWVNCLSSGDTEVALFRTAPRFDEKRRQLRRWLKDVKPLP